MAIILTAYSNSLEITRGEHVIAGGIQANDVEFRFPAGDTTWTGMALIGCFESNLGQWCQLLDENNCCVVPWEVIAKGSEGSALKIGLYGADENDVGLIIRSTVWATVPFRILPGPDATPSREPTPSLYQQMLAAASRVADNAADVLKAADDVAAQKVYFDIISKEVAENTLATRTNTAAAQESAKKAADSEKVVTDAEQVVVAAKEQVLESEQTVLASEKSVLDARDEVLPAAEIVTEKAAETQTNATNAKASEVNAKTSEVNAKTSETNAAASEAEAEEWANKSQSYAEQATVPAVAGVYNVVLTDRVTSERYALIVEDGRLKLLGVSAAVEATELTLIDNGTGVSFAVVIESGKLILKEV